MDDKSIKQLASMIADRLTASSAPNLALRPGSVASISPAVLSRRIGTALASALPMALNQTLHESTGSVGVRAASPTADGLHTASGATSPLEFNRELMSAIAKPLGGKDEMHALASALAQRLQKPGMSGVARLLRRGGGAGAGIATSPLPTTLMREVVASRIADWLIGRIASGMVPVLDGPAVASAVAAKLRTHVDKLEKLQPAGRISATKP